MLASSHLFLAMFVNIKLYFEFLLTKISLFYVACVVMSFSIGLESLTLDFIYPFGMTPARKLDFQQLTGRKEV